MEWTELRKLSRASVHSTFARPVTYVPALGGAGTVVSVRLHTRYARIGDLDREGYSQTIEEIERVIFLASDVARLGIRRGGSITTAEGQKYRLDLKDPTKDDFTVEFQVVRSDA
jgi:hypothetical protein